MYKNSRYVLNHQFNHSNKEVQDYLQSVFANSFVAYRDAYRNNISQYPNLDQDYKTILKGVEYLEEYLFYYHKFYPERFPDIFSSLNKKLKIVTVLPLGRRGIYGQFQEGTKTILINPSLLDSLYLTGQERTRLYMFHELGHVINSEWMNKVPKHLAKLKDDSDTKTLMYKGFCLLDEAITQNRAEAMAYYYAGKKRPMMQSFRGKLFNNTPYRSNFDYYKELQEVAITFGKTLRGIGNSITDEDVLKKLSIVSLDPLFVDRIVDEYKKDGHIDELYSMLMYLGIIKNASYALFGYSDPKYIEASGYAKKEFDKLAVPLRDYRKSYS